MVYVKCKIHNEEREPCKVKALIDTTSTHNFISKRIIDKLELSFSKMENKKYIPGGEPKNALGFIDCLELTFEFEGKDKFLTGADEVMNDFIVTEQPKAELVLGLPWLWLREALIDIHKEKILIYGEPISIT